MGEIGYDRREFLYDLKLWEIRSIIRGYRKRAALTWEPARFQTFCWLKARGAQIYRPQEIAKFPWEGKAEPMSQKEVEELKADMEAAYDDVKEFFKKKKEKEKKEAG